MDRLFLERGSGFSQYYKHHHYEGDEQQAADEMREGGLGLHADLKTDPVVDSADGSAGWRVAAEVELQTYAGGMGRLEYMADLLRYSG